MQAKTRMEYGGLVLAALVVGGAYLLCLAAFFLWQGTLPPFTLAGSLGYLAVQIALALALRAGARVEGWIIALLARRPVADTPTGMRKALAALMRIGGDSFTLEAINATISGCGVHAHVEEKEIPGEVAVSFPDIPGIPKGFKEIREIIEDILPAHLGIEYVFWYITWEELERKISCWAEIEERQLTWEQLETLVDETEEWAGT